LIEANWIIERDVERSKVGRPATATYIANPKIFEQFSDMAPVFKRDREKRKEQLDEFLAERKA
jgi:hypothetical protein